MVKDLILVLDIETGGLDYKKDSICSISVMLYDESNQKTWYIKPYNKNYNKKALEINHLDLNYLETCGCTLSLFFIELEEYCIKHFGVENLGKIQLLGHNVSFDIQFLKEALENDLNGFMSYKDLFHYHYKDSMVLCNCLKETQLIPIKQSISLKNIYVYLFKEDKYSNNAHNSLEDCIMTLRVYKKLISIIKN